MKTKNNFGFVGIDTNIFVYYFEENPQFGQAAKKIVDALSNSTLQGVTSIIAIIEALSKKDLPEKVAKDLEESFFEIPNLSILEVDRKIGAQAASIRRAYGFRLPDTIQLATALSEKAKAFITNDMRLKKFKELKVILLKEL